MLRVNPWARSLAVPFVCGLLLTSGCASSGSESGFSGSQPAGRDNQVTVINEDAVPITVYAWWDSGRRVRLGNLGGVSTRTFTMPSRGAGIWFEIEDQTTINSRRSRRPVDFVPVGPGDHLEVITGRETFTGRSGVILSVRRIPRI